MNFIRAIADAKSSPVGPEQSSAARGEDYLSDSLTYLAAHFGRAISRDALLSGLPIEDGKLTPAGDVVVVEARGLQLVAPDGTRDWIIETLGPGGGDGFCVDADGRYYVASTSEHGIRVVEPDGTVVDFLEIAGDGLTTNCCFGGPDLRTL